MKVFGFIFARGGSKGLPGKNVKMLAGKPMICYSIEAALACACIDQVFVSTDDNEIAEVAKNTGAEVIHRPSTLAQDNSDEWLAWRHAIQWVKDKYGDFSIFVSLPVTSPLRSVDDIQSAVEQLIQSGADICISVTAASRSPFFNMVTKHDGNVSLVIEPSTDVYRRQDAPEVFDITTVVYATTPHYVMTQDRLFSGKVTAIEVPKERAVDIDDIYDFKFAEMLINEMRL
ncbi:acylneuraminate cytidylyltransferase family protein [Neptuniibacter pectenicola]|uniref:acylneuraminate cytidylyltransferase family protein n=1 Tax=Neptuniibacter pectenicola TaxID=1806669 RepID=UPI00082FFD67|nr:acylneuraminate cytidylyltransferase family protein [Neptuniibacter pectenicola]